MFRLVKVVFLLLILVASGCTIASSSIPFLPTSQDASPASPGTGSLPTASASILPGGFPVTVWDEKEKSHLFFLLDPDSGKELPDYPPISLGEHFIHSLSPNRLFLAAAAPGSLLLLDLEKWNLQIHELPTRSFAREIEFNPDGKLLSVFVGEHERKVLLFDINLRRIIAQKKLDFDAWQLKFTQDGRGLMIYGTTVQSNMSMNGDNANTPIVALLDSTDLDLLWWSELSGIRHGSYLKDEIAAGEIDYSQFGTWVYMYPGLAFAPSLDLLFIVHPDQDKLTRVDFTSFTVDSFEIRAAQAWFERLLAIFAGTAQAKIAEGTSKRAAISPDGLYLYVVGTETTAHQDQKGNWNITSTPLGLQVIRTSDGARLAHLDTCAEDLTNSPNGLYLYLACWEGNKSETEVYDVTRSEVISHQEGIVRPAYRLNGEALLVSSEWMISTGNRLTFLDSDSLEALAEWSTHQPLGLLSSP